MKNIINTSIAYPYSEYGAYETKFLLAELHDKFLKLLLIFDGFCKKHNIYYSLADGTLLGAMRHGDFIPWDDDADVMVTREEYIKLREAIKTDNTVLLFKAHFLDRITTNELKNEEIYIDLFINEDMPKSRLIFEWKKLKTRFLRCSFNNNIVRNVRHDHYGFIHSHLRELLSIFLRKLAKFYIGNRDVFELNDKVVAINKHRPSGMYTRFTSRMYETNRRFDKNSYNCGYAYVNFRGHKLMTIKNAENFLREMYGDYMKLLSEEKRKPEHPVNMMESPQSCIKWYND